MPGSIHVTVLEAVDLPAELKESPELLAVKVSLGSQEFTTRYRRFETKSTGSWDSDFAFPVLNLKDKLGVALCDPEGKILTKCEIEVPSILQQGYREEYVELSEGGRLHLKLSFVLTDEERKKVNEMRAAAQRKKEKEQKDEMMVRRSNKLTKSIERAYDFKRKEDYCTDNGLRTIAENKEEHAGKPLDNWEVLSRKKDEEVSPANLFALPQPPQPPTLKSSAPVESGKPVELIADRERCSKNKYTSPCSVGEGVLCHSSLNQDNIMEGTVTALSLEPTIRPCISSEVAETPPDSQSEVGARSLKAPVTDNAQATPFVLPETDEQKENRPAPLTSVDNTCSVGSQDDHFTCHAPEVEECMEFRVLETRQEVKNELSSSQGFVKPREENPFFPNGLPGNNPVEPDSDTAGTQVQSLLKETKVATRQLLAPKENVTTFQEAPTLVQGVVAAVRMSNFSDWESCMKLPRVKEVDSISAKFSPHAHVLKDFPSEVQTRSGEKVKIVSSTLEVGSPKSGVRESGEKLGTLPSTVEDGSPKLGAVGIELKDKSLFSSPEVGSPKPGVRGLEENGGTQSSSTESVDVGAGWAEEKIKLPSSVPNVASPGVGLYQLDARQTGSPRLLRTALNSLEADSTTVPNASLSSYESGSPRISQTFARVEKIPGLLSRLLSDDCTDPEKKCSLLTSTTPVPMDGWVCVERPPMTWEDALKVAQKAREAALAAQQHTTAPFPLPSPVKLPTNNIVGPRSPVAPMVVANGPTMYSLPSAQDACDTLMRPPPKSSLSKASIATGYAIPHIETYESDSNQTFDQSSVKGGNIIMQAETLSPTGVQTVSRGRRLAEEELIKWEERLRNWGQAAELKVIPEESRHRNHDREKQLSWGMDDFEDSIRKDFEARLQSPSSDCESTSSRLAVPATEVRWDVEGGTRSKWLREDTEALSTIDRCVDFLEDLQVEDMEESLMEEADLIIESLCKSLEPASDYLSPREQATDSSICGEDSEPRTEEENQQNSLIGGALKQVLGGALLAVGVFVLWPKNAGTTERYHVVKTGESLSNILDEQAIDPSSRFCKLNPKVCERKAVYPGQRLRLT